MNILGQKLRNTSMLGAKLKNAQVKSFYHKQRQTLFKGPQKVKN